MLGMLLGMLLVRLVADSVPTLWLVFLLLTAFHVYGARASPDLTPPSSFAQHATAHARNKSLQSVLSLTLSLQDFFVLHLWILHLWILHAPSACAAPFNASGLRPTFGWPFCAVLLQPTTEQSTASA